MKKSLVLLTVTILLCSCGKTADDPAVDLDNAAISIEQNVESEPEITESVEPTTVPTEEPSVEATSESSVEATPEPTTDPEAVVTTSPIIWAKAYADSFFNDSSNFKSSIMFDAGKNKVTLRIENKVIDLATNVDFAALDSMFSDPDNLMTNYSVDGGSMHSWYWAKSQIMTTNAHVIATNGKFKEANVSGLCIGEDEEIASIDGIGLLSTVDDVLATYGTPMHYECNGEYPIYNLFMEWDNYDNYIVDVSFTVLIDAEDNTLRTDRIDYIRVMSKTEMEE